MKLDWKRISQSTGYKSLKTVYIKDASRWCNNKKEYYKDFLEIISKLTHHVYKKGAAPDNGKPFNIYFNTTLFITILDKWEEKRTYSWRNFYHGNSFNKIHSNSLKKPGMQQGKKYYKRENLFGKQFKTKRILQLIQQHQPKRDEIKKPRWDNERKARMKAYRDRHSRNTESVS